MSKEIEDLLRQVTNYVNRKKKIEDGEGISIEKILETDDTVAFAVSANPEHLLNFAKEIQRGQELDAEYLNVDLNSLYTRLIAYSAIPTPDQEKLQQSLMQQLMMHSGNYQYVLYLGYMLGLARMKEVLDEQETKKDL